MALSIDSVFLGGGIKPEDTASMSIQFKTLKGFQPVWER